MAIKQPIFILPEVLTGVASGNEVAGHLASYLGRSDAIGLTWRSSGATSVWARGQFGGATKAIDFCSIVSANALPGTTIRLRLGTSQAQVDGSGAPYDSTPVAFINPSITRDDGLYHSHLELPSVQNATWWRVDIGSHTGDFEASTLTLGLKRQSAKFMNYDWEYGVSDTGKADINRYAVMDRQAGAILRTVDFTLDWITEAEWETVFRPMVEKLGTTGIVHVVFDPEPTVYRQARTYMGIFRKAPFARGKRKPKTFGGDFQILSFV